MLLRKFKLKSVSNADFFQWKICSRERSIHFHSYRTIHSFFLETSPILFLKRTFGAEKHTGEGRGYKTGPSGIFSRRLLLKMKKNQNGSLWHFLHHGPPAQNFCKKHASWILNPCASMKKYLNLNQMREIALKY